MDIISALAFLFLGLIGVSYFYVHNDENSKDEYEKKKKELEGKIQDEFKQMDLKDLNDLVDDNNKRNGAS